MADVEERPARAADYWWRSLPNHPFPSVGVAFFRFVTIDGVVYVRRDVMEEAVAEGVQQERVRLVMERQMAKQRLLDQQARRTAKVIEAGMMLSLWSVAAWLAWRAIACWF